MDELERLKQIAAEEEAKRTGKKIPEHNRIADKLYTKPIERSLAERATFGYGFDAKYYKKLLDEQNEKNPNEIQKDDPLLAKVAVPVGNVMQGTAMGQIWNRRIDELAEQIYRGSKISDDGTAAGGGGGSWGGREYKDLTPQEKDKYEKAAVKYVEDETAKKILRSEKLPQIIAGEEEGLASRRYKTTIEEKENANAKSIAEQMGVPTTSMANRTDNNYYRDVKEKEDAEKIKKIRKSGEEYAKAIEQDKIIAPSIEEQMLGTGTKNTEENAVSAFMQRRYGAAGKPTLPRHNPKVNPLISKVRMADIINLYGGKLFGIDMDKHPLAKTLTEVTADLVDLTLLVPPAKLAAKGLSTAAGMAVKNIPKMAKVGSKLERMGENFKHLDIARETASKTQNPLAILDLPDDAPLFKNIAKENDASIRNYLKNKGLDENYSIKQVKEFVADDSKAFIAGKTPIGEGAVKSKANNWWETGKEKAYQTIDKMENSDNPLVSLGGKAASGVVGKRFVHGYGLKKAVFNRKYYDDKLKDYVDISPDKKRLILDIAEETRTGKPALARELHKTFVDNIKGTEIEGFYRLDNNIKRDIFNYIETGNIDSEYLRNMLTDEGYEALSKIYKMKKDATKEAFKRKILTKDDFITHHMTHINDDVKYLTGKRREIHGTANEAEALLAIKDDIIQRSKERGKGKFSIIDNKGEDVIENVKHLPDDQYIIWKMNDARALEIKSSEMPKLVELYNADALDKLNKVDNPFNETTKNMDALLNKYNIPHKLRQEYAELVHDDRVRNIIQHGIEIDGKKIDGGDITLRDLLDKYQANRKTEIKTEKEIGKRGLPVTQKYSRDVPLSILQNTENLQVKNYMYDQLKKIEAIDLPGGSKMVIEIPNAPTKDITQEMIDEMKAQVKANELTPYGERPRAWFEKADSGSAKKLTSKSTVYVHPELSDFVNNYERNYGVGLKTVHRFVTQAKAVMTVARPEMLAFMMGNASSGVTVNMAIAKNKIQLADGYALATKMQRVRSGNAKPFMIKSPTYGNKNATDIIKEMDRLGALENFGVDISGAPQAMKEVLESKSSQNMTPKIAVKEGVGWLGKQAKSLSPLPIGGTGNLADFEVVKRARQLNEVFESENRLAAIAILYKQGKTYKQIADKVKELFIDYSALTPFERDALSKTAIPFYTFFKGSSKAMLANPTIAKDLASLYRAKEGQEVSKEDLTPEISELRRRGNYPPFATEYKKGQMLDPTRYTYLGGYNVAPEQIETWDKNKNEITEYGMSMMNNMLNKAANPFNYFNIARGADYRGRPIPNYNLGGNIIKNKDDKALVYALSTYLPAGQFWAGWLKYFPDALSRGSDPGKTVSTKQEMPWIKAVFPRKIDMNAGKQQANNIHYTSDENLFTPEHRNINSTIKDWYIDDWKMDGNNHRMDMNKIREDITNGNFKKKFAGLIISTNKVIPQSAENALLYLASSNAMESKLNEPITVSKSNEKAYNEEIAKKRKTLDDLQEMGKKLKDEQNRMKQYTGQYGLIQTMAELSKIYMEEMKRGTNTKQPTK